MGMIKELEERYPEGSDLTIMDTFYQYPIFQDGKKISDDFIILIYKDNNIGKKGHCIIKDPTYIYYILKQGQKVPDYNKLFIEKDKVEPVEVPFHDLEYSIAKETDNIPFYKANLANRDRRENQKLHTDPRVFFSDVSIENHYRFRFAQTYTNNIEKLHKSFFDIEVDGKWAKGDFVELGECAINCVSFHDEAENKTYTFILRDKRNPQIEAFENEVASGKFGIKEIRDFIRNAVGGPDKEEKYKLADTTYELLFFDYEIQLIQALFATIHRCNPDFCEGWNSSAFDIEYIIERIKTLGYDPAKVMCDAKWPAKVVKNYVDYRNINNLAERGDYTFISGETVFMDQMIQYASRRKAKIGSYSSFKLDDIGLKEAGVQKLDYSHITNSVTELPWLDFKTFVIYNIMDTTVQKCIEHQTQDLEYIFAKCVNNNTVYQKGHRQTVYLINRLAADFYKMGYIIGNNCNKWNEKPPKFLGALVGKPLNTNDYSKLKIDGRPIWICDNLIDFDFKSLYPSLMLEFNIAPNTQIGRITINEKVYGNENAYSIEDEKYSRGGEFVDNMITDNHIEFCKRWYHLAGFKEFLSDIKEYYKSKAPWYRGRIVKENDAISISPLRPSIVKAHNPFEKTYKKSKGVFQFVGNKPKEYTYDNIIKSREQKNPWED